MTEERAEQPLNVELPMVVIDFGMVIEAKLLQYSNALFPMFVTELGMVTDDSLVQLAKALLPMVVTEPGIVTMVSPVHPEKALLLIVVTSSPKTISLMAVLLLNQFPTSLQWKVTEERAEQPENAELPMVVIDFGMVIDTKLLQF